MWNINVIKEWIFIMSFRGGVCWFFLSCCWVIWRATVSYYFIMFYLLHAISWLGIWNCELPNLIYALIHPGHVYFKFNHKLLFYLFLQAIVLIFQLNCKLLNEYSIIHSKTQKGCHFQILCSWQLSWCGSARIIWISLVNCHSPFPF